MRTVALACFVVVNVAGAALFTFAALVLGEIDQTGPSWRHLLLTGVLVAVVLVGAYCNLRFPRRLGLGGLLLLAILPLTLTAAVSFSTA